MKKIRSADYNRSVILNAIRREKAISRLELGRLTRIRLNSVGEAVSRLLAEGLVSETGKKSSGGGRKRALLGIDHDHNIVLGVHYDSGFIRIAEVGLDGRIRDRTQISRNFKDAEELVREMKKALKTICGRLQAGGKKIQGIGLGCPGIIDPDSGMIVLSTNIKGWKEINLEKELEEALRLPVHGVSAGKLLLLAEKIFGVLKEREYRDVVYITLGTGIGSAIIANGEIISGARGMAGEIGHTKVAGEKIKCRCGNYGCLDAIVSGEAVLKQIREIAGNKTLQFRDVPKLKSSRARACLIKAGGYIGMAVANLVNILNPEIVIFSGDLCRYGPEFLGTIITTTEKNILPVHIGKIVYEKSELGADTGALGAAALIINNLFEFPAPYNKGDGND